MRFKRERKMGTYLKEAAKKGILPSILVLMFQIVKHCEKEIIYLILISVSIAYACITCFVFLFYLYTDRKFKRN